MRALKLLIHIAIIAWLSLISQVGGVIWLLVFLGFRIKGTQHSKRIRLFAFCIAYLIFSLLVIPQLAMLNGRTALPMHKDGDLIPHNYMTILLNRHYIIPSLKEELESVAQQFEKQNPGSKLSYLDANFPFINGFPLLPHLSHDDGKKVDLAFQYLKQGKATNKKPSRSGYGVFEKAKDDETNQSQICKEKKYWHYDYPKYLSFGSRKDLTFDESRTKGIINLLLRSKSTQKIFLEPHLKDRLALNNSKIRYQGCHSVRHDDHIHLQVN